MSAAGIANQRVVLVSHHPRETSKSPCVSVYHLFVSPHAPFSLAGFLHTTGDQSAFDAELERLKDQDVVFLFNGMTSLAHENALRVLRYAVLEQKEVIVYWHETAWNMRFFFNRYKQFMDEAVALLSSERVTHWSPTQQLQQLLLYIFGCPRSRIEIVFEVLPIQDVPLRDRSSLPASELSLVAAGIPDQRKGCDLFIKLSKQFATLRDRTCRYLWYAARESRTSYAEEADHGRVEWQGCRTDFQQCLLQADAFLMMSRDDPSPIVCLEAMACDIPVFCFDTIGYAEILPPEFVCRDTADMEAKITAYFDRMADYPAGFFRRIAERYTPVRFTEKLEGQDGEDRVHFPVGDHVDLARVASRALIGLAKARENNRLAEEKFKLRMNGIAQQIRTIRQTATEAARRASLERVERLESENAERETEVEGLKNERRFLLEAHRQSRMELKSLLRRQLPTAAGRAIVVGNSPNVLHQHMGDMIDAFDVVIRLNNFRIAEFESHVGRRVDKAFVSVACRPNPELAKLSPESIYFYPADKHADRAAARARVQRPDGTQIDLDAVQHLSPSLYFYGLKILIGLEERQWPSTGLVALQWAVDHLSRSHTIYYHGFSFYEESDAMLQHYFGEETKRDSHHDFFKERVYAMRLEAEGKIQPLSDLATARAA